ncbi:S8 family serine peptidase [Vibrio sp. Of7-15]|uniref:S8 family serine peptidase n=1 Tax=Vibrio sp. Of7-15 TaxID=2724879 RepID=UPI001EF2343D|nr:S8 family serine peptidase [Vibrio sp. Of7-15]MCG7498648.1 S8 family serine peptidase [Vibrio sp. Of7-15]
MSTDMEIDNIVLTVTPKSSSGLSIYSDLDKLSVDSLKLFLPPEGVIDTLCREFQELGILIEARSEVGISISLSSELAGKLFNCQFLKRRNRFIREFTRNEITTVGEIDISSLTNAEYIECINLPKGSFELSLVRPSLDYHVYAVPEQVADIAGVTELSAAGLTGVGVKVAVIDTGLWDHPHFIQHHYRTSTIPAVSLLDPTRDERGHGTAMSSVALSIAPDVDLTMIKMCNREMSYPVAALQKAVEIKPDIINCSWGTIGHEPTAHLEVVNALAKGIQVIFSSGNGSTDRKDAIFQSIAPPDCITVGGVYMDSEQVELSGISSSYRSDVYSERNVPDLCGLCGHLPNARLILFPTEPGSDHDARNGKTDGTGSDDGWLVSSGTSAAAAWVTGFLALLIQADKSLSVQRQKYLLRQACLKVDKGTSNTGDVATGKENCLATGAGLVHGSKLPIAI